MRRLLLPLSAVLLVGALAACTDGDGDGPSGGATDTTLATPEPAGAPLPDPAPRGAPGDDGTIKVFDAVGCAGGEAGNNPKVTSPFSIGGTGFDPGDSGTLTIKTQPGDREVFSTSLTVGAGGTFCVTPIDLPPGQYKAVFNFGNGTGKQKVFKIEGAETTTTSTSSTTTTTIAGTTTTEVEGITPTVPPVGPTTTDLPDPPEGNETTTTEAESGSPTTAPPTTAPPTTVPPTTVPPTTEEPEATTTTEVDSRGGAPTTTVAPGGGGGGGGGGVGSGGGTTLPTTTPGTGSSSSTSALVAALALIAGLALLRIARRPAPE